MSNDLNIYGNQQVQPQQKSTTTEMMTSRQAQEVQAAMVIAKKFPRDQIEAFNNLMTACQRISLAKTATYTFPRGNKQVSGPSIRLAEAIAQTWGNLDFGTIELERKDGESQVMTYAWDLETNTRQTKVFSTRHWRDTKNGGYKLTDERDIYEAVANNGARRLRACILGVIPGDVVEAAVEQCKLTIEGSYDKPLVDRVRDMVKAFEDKYSVTLEMIEKYIGYKSSAFSEDNFENLRGVYAALRDGMAKRESYFDVPKVAPESDIPDTFNRENKNPAPKKAPKAKPNNAKAKGEPEQQTLDSDLLGTAFDQNIKG